MNAIELKDLSKSYPDFTLDRLTLTLPSGCILGLIGENGAGKSTTMRLLLGVLRRDSGSVRLLGRELREDDRLLLEDVGVVPDEIGLPHSMTARQIGKIMRNTYRNWDDSVYSDLLARLSVPEKKPFKTFSLGMQKKLGIAVALSHHPKLLLLDEATSGLDPVVRDELLDLFMEFTRDETHAILIAAHIGSDLEKVCDYVAFLHKGKLMLCEEKDRLREQYTVVRVPAEQFASLPPSAVVGRKEGPYGVEAIVRKDAVPAGLPSGPVDIEQLFIFMVKEAK